MVSPRRIFVLIAAVVGMLLISACGSAPATTTGNTASAPTTAPTPTTAAATPTTAAADNVVVKTAQATVDGKALTILTDTKGMTLYYYTPDTSQNTACTGGCAQNWPPLLFTGTGTKVAADTQLPGELEIYKNANGNQVIYKDHPLYTFIGDTAPGQVTGQGKGGKWFVATPDIPQNK